MSDSVDSGSGDSGSFTSPDSFSETVPTSVSGGGNAGDSFSESSTQGWGSRLMGSVVAALIGLVLLPAAIGILYWNEGRALDAARALDRGVAAIAEVSSAAVDPGPDGTLVHLSGLLHPATPAKDPVFGVTADGLTRLKRTVEMYQWEEHVTTTTHDNVGGSKTTEKTYNYRRDWSEHAIDSGNFRVPANHQNPAMRQHTAIFDGAGVKVGAWQLDPSVLDKVTAFGPVHAEAPPPPGYQATEDGYYSGQNPSVPMVGDLRVGFAGAPSQTISVAAARSSGTLTAFRDRNGFTIALAEPGVVSAATLFHDEQQGQSVMTWILRAVGFAMILIAFLCLMAPLTAVFAVLPFLEGLVGAGTLLIAITLAVPVTLVTISVAWIAHRPLIGGLLLAGAVLAWFTLRRFHPRRTGAVQA